MYETYEGYHVVDLPYRSLEHGERIRNGDFFRFKDGWFAATDVGTGVMDENHYPHYRFTNEK